MGLRLQDGDRVGIIGGGPGGSFAALHLLALAAKQGLRLEIVIFEPHTGLVCGPKGCKGCAGILSDGAVRNMATLGLQVPEEVVQSELRSYVVHVAGQVTTIVQPDPGRHIFSVYRGAGPRLHDGAPLHGLDAYLLGRACAAGAQHIPQRVRSVEWEDGPVIYADDLRLPCALLVLATGVNSRPPLAPAFGYQAPATALMAQDEIPRPANWPADKVAGFFDQPPGLMFGAIVPKGPYLNISLLWRGPVADAVRQFYTAQSEALRYFFPDLPPPLCGCNPRILVKPAPLYYGDRWVAVGDAAVARLFKDGMNSAFATSGRAMQTAVQRGIDRASFAEGYAPLCRQIARDNRYGAFLYTASSRVLRSLRLAGAFVNLIDAEAWLSRERQVHSRLMWGMLTGDESYHTLFRLFLQPRGLLGLGRELAANLGRRSGDRPAPAGRDQ